MDAQAYVSHGLAQHDHLGQATGLLPIQQTQLPKVRNGFQPFPDLPALRALLPSANDDAHWALLGEGDQHEPAYAFLDCVQFVKGVLVGRQSKDKVKCVYMRSAQAVDAGKPGELQLNTIEVASQALLGKTCTSWRDLFFTRRNGEYVKLCSALQADERYSSAVAPRSKRGGNRNMDRAEGLFAKHLLSFSTVPTLQELDTLAHKLKTVNDELIAARQGLNNVESMEVPQSMRESLVATARENVERLEAELQAIAAAREAAQRRYQEAEKLMFLNLQGAPAGVTEMDVEKVHTLLSVCRLMKLSDAGLAYLVEKLTELSYSAALLGLPEQGSPKRQRLAPPHPQPGEVTAGYQAFVAEEAAAV